MCERSLARSRPTVSECMCQHFAIYFDVVHFYFFFHCLNYVLSLSCFFALFGCFFFKNYYYYYSFASFHRFICNVLWSVLHIFIYFIHKCVDFFFCSLSNSFRMSVELNACYHFKRHFIRLKRLEKFIHLREIRCQRRIRRRRKKKKKQNQPKRHNYRLGSLLFYLLIVYFTLQSSYKYIASHALALNCELFTVGS